MVRQEIRAGEGRGAARALRPIPAVRDGWLREIKSPLILQPGPAALTDGLDAMVAIFDRWAETVAQESQPGGSSSLSPLGRELG